MIDRRTGTLWEGCYKSGLFDGAQYLFTCLRYMELNPVRAGVVNHPGEYKWSSYHANALGIRDSLIESHPLYLALGHDAEVRQTAYRELFRHYMDNDMLHEIREALNHELVLGRSYFKDKIEKVTQRQTRMGLPGRPKIEEEEGVYFTGY